MLHLSLPFSTQILYCHYCFKITNEKYQPAAAWVYSVHCTVLSTLTFLGKPFTFYNVDGINGTLIGLKNIVKVFSILPGIYVQCPCVHPRILVCSPKLVPVKELSKGITSFFSLIYDAFEFLLMVGTPHKPLFKTDAMPPNVLFKNVIGALLKP